MNLKVIESPKHKKYNQIWTKITSRKNLEKTNKKGGKEKEGNPSKPPPSFSLPPPFLFVSSRFFLLVILVQILLCFLCFGDSITFRFFKFLKLLGSRKLCLIKDSFFKSGVQWGSYSGGNLLLARYHASTVVGFLVLAGYWWNIGTDTDIVLVRPLIIIRLGVGSQYWARTLE